MQSMGHDVQDRISLEIARQIARELAARPEWIDQARENLARWRTINANAPALLRCYAEWEELLGQPIPVVVQALTAETEEGQRLRQNSPFAGALPAQVIWDIKRRLRDETIAA
jgi:hypothetical protein